MIDAIDVGNEVRKQYVPKHVQMPEVRMSTEILHVGCDILLKVAASSENTFAIIKPDSTSHIPTVQPSRNAP